MQVLKQRRPHVTDRLPQLSSAHRSYVLLRRMLNLEQQAKESMLSHDYGKQCVSVYSKRLIKHLYVQILRMLIKLEMPE